MRGAVKYLILLFVGIISVSCRYIFDPEPIVMPMDEVRSVMFTVSLEGGKTRAEWDEEYPADDGVAFDYRINPDMMHVAVLAEDNTPLGTIENLAYFPINEAQTEFQFMGEMPTTFVEHFNGHAGEEPNYKFMVMANCYDGASTLEAMTYSYSQLDPTSAEGSIPMWGVQQVDMSPLVDNAMLDIGEIWLLRAAAKVEVKLSDVLKQQGVTIVSSTLKYYNQMGYCLPEGWAGVSSTRRLDQENCMRQCRQVDLNMPLVCDDTTGDYFVYVCEFDNKNYPSERNKISLEFNIGGEVKTFEDAISFCQYSNGAPVDGSHYNIVRNHIYEFKIRSIDGTLLTLDFNVADWVEDEQTMDYHNTVTVSENDRLRWTAAYDVAHGGRTTINTDGSVTTLPVGIYAETRNDVVDIGSTAGGVAECDFGLFAPVGGEWYAELVTIQGEVGAIVFEDGNTVNSGAIGYPWRWDGESFTVEELLNPRIKLRIKSTKSNDTSVSTTNNIAELRISAKKSWGGKLHTYKVYGLTGLANNTNFKIIQPLGVGGGKSLMNVTR